jgi:predicted fused transcriptional regulator/phosphomethylpyrimidine kinase
VKILEKCKELATLIPEVRSNIVMARKNAKEVNDIAGIPGRITVVNGKPRAFMDPEMGASSHMARLILKIMKYDPSKQSAMNIKCDKKIIDICKKLGLKVSFYDRSNEPEDIKQIEGSTIPWGAESAINRIGEVPDIIYHGGSWGKEPSISIIGTDAVDVAKMAVCIAKLYNLKNNY